MSNTNNSGNSSDSGYSTNDNNIKNVQQFFQKLKKAETLLRKAQSDADKMEIKFNIIQQVNKFLNGMTFEMVIEIMSAKNVGNLIKYNKSSIFEGVGLSYFLATRVSTAFRIDKRINTKKRLLIPNNTLNLNSLTRSYNKLYRSEHKYLDFIDIGDAELIIKFGEMLDAIYNLRINEKIPVLSYLTYFDEFVKVSYIICCFHELPGYDIEKSINYLKNPRIFKIIIREFYPYLNKYAREHQDFIKNLETNYKLMTSSNSRGINTNLSFIATKKNNSKKKNNLNNMKMISELLKHIKNSEIKETTV